MLRLLMLLIVLSIIIIAASFGFGSPQESDDILIVSIVGWFIILATIIFLFYKRLHLQKKYKKQLEESEGQSSRLDAGEYFYQVPLYLYDDQPVKVLGQKDISFELAFKNNLHKWLSIGQAIPLQGIKLISKENTIEIIPTKIVFSRPLNDVYLNGEKIGRYDFKSIKEGSLKQYLSLEFKTEKGTYEFNNSYADLVAKLVDPNQQEILTGERSLFDFSKSDETKLRGEKHRITITQNKEYPEEIWLALYIQAMIIKDK